MTQPTPPRIVGRIGKMRVNKQSRYHDGERSYQRMSTLLKEIETDTFYLDEWKANMLAIGLAGRADLVLGVAAAAQYDERGKLTSEAKSTLRGLRYQAENAARSKAGANQGTAVHTATERLDLGESVAQIALPHPFDADLAAYEALKLAMGITYRPEHIERSVRNERLDIVGTYDREAESSYLVELGILAPGELIVTDVKTEDDPLRNLIHIAPQLAGYAQAETIFVPEPRPYSKEDPYGEYAGRYEPAPRVNREVGLVIHVRNGRATPYLVDLIAGWTSALRAAEQRDELKRSKIKLGDDGCWAVPVPIDLPDTTRSIDSAAVAAAATQHALDRGGQKCLVCQKPIEPGRPHTCLPMRTAETAVVQQSVRGPDGTVTWQAVPDGPQPLEAMIWQDVMEARSLDALGALFERASAQGVAWVGPISDAGILRAKIVQCVQRELHVTGACACGWLQGMAP